MLYMEQLNNLTGWEGGFTPALPTNKHMIKYIPHAETLFETETRE
jgi:hypothetical protein